MNNTHRVIIITGPTGVGKTSLSIKLAKKCNGEIISADSMQIYSDMDIGTAKVKKEDMEGIPHHLIDVVSPFDSFSVAEFQRLALNKIKELVSEKKTPIVVGGTGLYIDSLIYNLDFSETKANLKRREELDNILESQGKQKLLQILENLDTTIKEKIDINNPRRIIRAIEVLENNKDKKNFKEDTKEREDYVFNIFVLKRNREVLYDIINRRVDIMIEEGFVQEVQLLKNRGLNMEYQAMKAIGYRQINEYLDGNISFEESVELIKRDSRRYAKRQLTWFKKYDKATVIDVDKFEIEELFSSTKKIIEKSVN